MVQQTIHIVLRNTFSGFMIKTANNKVLRISLRLEYTRSSDYTKASSGIFIQKQTWNPETIIVGVINRPCQFSTLFLVNHQ